MACVELLEDVPRHLSIEHCCAAYNRVVSVATLAVLGQTIAPKDLFLLLVTLWREGIQPICLVGECGENLTMTMSTTSVL